ncbi:MAG TPA: tetratricopeptide repeat protein, partial [Planctomycetota bacterium]|nr:tetratricopeptide repeat protein [Planctomycetota bacterium]
DYLVWGMNPFGYHLTNVLFHAATALVVFWVLDRLLRLARPGSDARTRCGAAAAGALFFSLHPLRVESVAWITERRDVVSGFFILLTVLAYLKMAAAAPGSPERRKGYGLTLLWFILGLLSKPTGMTLPLVFLILDVYPLKRSGAEPWRGLLLEKVPFFALMIGSAALTFVSLRHAHAVYTWDTYPPLQRLVQPGFRVSFYVAKTLMPLSLSPLYEYHPEIGWAHLIGWLTLAAVTAGVLLRRRQLPAAAAAWVAFGLLIAPVSGVFQAGMHFAADRYSYLPCLPFAALFAAAVASAPPRIPRPAVLGLAAAVLVALALMTLVQEQVWKDSLALWNRVLRLDPHSYFALNNRGAAKADQGDFAGAMADYDASIAIREDWEKSWNNRAIELARRGDHAQAAEAFSRSLQIEPDQVKAYGYRALSRLQTGDLAGGRQDLDEALRRRPDALYYVKRAMLRGMEGNLDGVIGDCAEALRLRPVYPEARMHLGMAYLQKGDAARASLELGMALRTAVPGSPQAVQIERLLRSLLPKPR